MIEQKKKVREKRYRDGKEEENTKQGNAEIRMEKKVKNKGKETRDSYGEESNRVQEIKKEKSRERDKQQKTSTTTLMKQKKLQSGAT